MTIVDTTVWIDLLNGLHNPQTEWHLAHAPRERLGLTELILAEVLEGTNGEVEFRRTEALLHQFDILTSVNQGIAITAARNYQFLRVRGITVRKTIDCFIATFCLVHGHALLHRDRCFDHFERELGLKVIKV